MTGKPSFLRKYGIDDDLAPAPHQEPSYGQPDEAPLATSVGGAFTWLRGVRDQAKKLRFVRQDGRALSLDYGWLPECSWTPSDGSVPNVLVLRYVTGHEITIIGVNLQSLYDEIERCRATSVHENARDPLHCQALKPGQDGVFEIRIKEPEKENRAEA